MKTYLDQLDATARLLMEADLVPLQGERFQPTGFADLGSARYTLADGTEMLLVESAQSVANRMELVCWDEEAGDLLPELRGLPYVRVDKDGKALTNSILEAHRINSEYIATGDFKEQLTKELGYAKDVPVDFPLFFRALLKYDPNCLIHGVFLEEIAGRLRVTRALSGFVEARGVRVAQSGGVKNNRVEPELKGGKGNVPFHRTEFTATRLTVYFNLDLALLRGFGLGKDVTRLLVALSLFKVQRFLSTGLRLRTACDLRLVDSLRVTLPEGFELPDEAVLLEECSKGIAACKERFADPSVTVVPWSA